MSLFPPQNAKIQKRDADQIRCRWLLGFAEQAGQGRYQELYSGKGKGLDVCASRSLKVGLVLQDSQTGYESVGSS
jgi:hypothetical protein